MSSTTTPPPQPTPPTEPLSVLAKSVSKLLNDTQTLQPSTLYPSLRDELGEILKIFNTWTKEIDAFHTENPPVESRDLVTEDQLLFWRHSLQNLEGCIIRLMSPCPLRSVIDGERPEGNETGEDIRLRQGEEVIVASYFVKKLEEAGGETV
ncbi:hypothetical protein OQA88_2659 [Cercophora sp. LCS_1]